MTDAVGTIWPQTVQGWFALVLAGGAVLALFYGVLDRVIKHHAKEIRGEMKEAAGALRTDLDGLGGRTKVLEEAGAGREARLTRSEADLAESRRDRAQLHERLGKMEGVVEKLDDKMTEMQINIIGAITNAREAQVEALHGVSNRLAVVEAVVERLEGRD